MIYNLLDESGDIKISENSSALHFYITLPLQDIYVLWVKPKALPLHMPSRHFL